MDTLFKMQKKVKFKKFFFQNISDRSEKGRRFDSWRRFSKVGGQDKLLFQEFIKISFTRVTPELKIKVLDGSSILEKTADKMLQAPKG